MCYVLLISLTNPSIHSLKRATTNQTTKIKKNLEVLVKSFRSKQISRLVGLSSQNKDLKTKTKDCDSFVVTAQAHF